MGEVEPLEGSDSNSRIQHHMFDSLEGCSCREMEGKKKRGALSDLRQYHVYSQQEGIMSPTGVVDQRAHRGR